MPNVNLAPSSYGIEAADIERRRKMAEALAMQGMQPLETNQTAGGYVVPVSPLQGLAKMLQSGLGGYGQRRAMDEERALAEKMRTQGAGEIGNFVQALRGREAVPAKMDVESGDVPAPEQAAVPGDKRAALAVALGSQNPMLQGAGSSMLAEMLKTPDSLFGKIDPKDYTPESVRIFAQTRDPSMLVPVRKHESMTTTGPNGAPVTSFYDPYKPPQGPVAQPVKNEMVNTGAQVVPVNPYAQSTPLGVSVSPNTVFTQNAENARHMTPSGSTLATNAVTRRGQDISASADIQGALAAARGAGTTTGTANAQAALDLPNVIAKAQQATELIDQMIGSKGKALPAGAKEVAPHPGFSTAVGATLTPGLKYIEGSDTAGFMRLLDQVKGGAFLQAFESLKGGGQITEVEGKKATDAINRMDKSQSEAEFVKAAREFQDVIRAGVQRAKGRAGGQPVLGGVLRFDAQGNPIQ